MNDEVSEFLIASFFGLLGWFFGGLDGFLEVLIACTIIDYITGICRAGSEGKISSTIAFRGIARKIVMFFLVGVAHIIDQHMLGDTAALRTAVILFYVGNEGISIIENAEKLGVPIPKFLHGKFLTFSEENNEKGLARNGKESEHSLQTNQRGGVTRHEEPRNHERERRTGRPVDNVSSQQLQPDSNS